MLEVEAKVRCPDVKGLRDRLLVLGATPGQAQIQEDIFFSHPNRDLAASDEALRLRKQGDALELTYKGPRQKGSGAKARVEQTVAVQDDPTPLLRSLGFSPTLRIQKRRQTWHLGQVEVSLDSLDGIGDFVEVEIMAANAEVGRRTVQTALESLRLQKEPLIHDSYIQLAVKAGIAQPRT